MDVVSGVRRGVEVRGGEEGLRLLSEKKGREEVEVEKDKRKLLIGAS